MRVFKGLLPICIAFVVRTEMLSRPQAAATPLAFEVASIKSDKTVGDSFFSGCYPGGRCIFRNVSLRIIVAYAYDIPIFRIEELISGGPDWIRNDKYDVEAKAENDSATESELKLMTQALLADRFKLTLHEITKESAGYALVVAKNGPKLKASDGSGRPSMGTTVERMSGHSASMANLAKQLSNKLHQPVVDKTKINGCYDFRLTFGADDNDQSGPSIFTALQEQLGLKLKSQKVPTRVLVIDHAEKPAGN